MREAAFEAMEMMVLFRDGRKVVVRSIVGIGGPFNPENRYSYPLRTRVTNWLGAGLYVGTQWLDVGRPRLESRMLAHNLAKLSGGFCFNLHDSAKWFIYGLYAMQLTVSE